MTTMMTFDEAQLISQNAQAQFLAAGPATWDALVAAFRQLLAAEIEATLSAGEGDPDAYLARPLSNTWNPIGTMLIKRGMNGCAERLFRESLARELQSETEYGIRLHKGYSYCNLGLAQVNQGNWDEGIQNIRRAVQEDICSGFTMENSHAHKVTHRMVVAPEKDALRALLTPVLNASAYAANPQVFDELFDSFTLEMSLQAAFSARTARTTVGDTEFGRTLRLNAVRDACHIFEAWLRERGHAGSGLRPCLDSAYGGGGAPWWSTTCTHWQLASAGSTAEAAAHLVDIIVATPALTPDDLLARSHLLAGLMRNWTHHQFDPGAAFLGGADYDGIYRSPWVCLWHAKASGL